MTIAAEESAAASSERDAAERVRLMEVLGADPAARTQPPHIRSQLSSLEKEQKARATRFTRDVIDRALVDLLSVYRDALVRAHRRGHGPGQRGQPPGGPAGRRARSGPSDLLRAMDAIGTARERIGANVNPLLALEAMALDLRLRVVLARRVIVRPMRHPPDLRTAPGSAAGRAIIADRDLPQVRRSPIVRP